MSPALDGTMIVSFDPESNVVAKAMEHLMLDLAQEDWVLVVSKRSFYYSI